jgi:hypothetical protein
LHETGICFPRTYMDPLTYLHGLIVIKLFQHGFDMQLSQI